MKLRILEINGKFYLQEKTEIFTWSFCKNLYLMDDNFYWYYNRWSLDIYCTIPVDSIEEAIEWANTWREKFEKPKKVKATKIIYKIRGGRHYG